MANTCKLQLDLIPDYIREDIGRTLLRSYTKSIREHPEKLEEYRRLGQAFLERQERKARENGAK